MLIGLCLEFPGLRVVWTSHHNRTTTNTFRSMQGMVNKPKITPFLAPNGIRTANGEQEIRFANGSIIMFGAREQGFGRGMDAIDIEVFDEAQILTIKALEDMVPATNQARNPHGGLLFFLGTPPRPSDPGEAFTAKRKQAIDGKPADADGKVHGTSRYIMFVEISADPGAKSDDRSQWPIMNPSYPHRTPLEAMLRMLENLPDDEAWRREAMGIWPVAGGGLITADQWGDLTDPKSAPSDPVSFGLYVNKDRTAAAIGVAGYREDGLIHIGIVPASSDAQGPDQPGTSWIPARIKELSDRWGPCAVVVDDHSAAGSLITAIQQLGVYVITTSASQMANACGNFYDGIVEKKIRHQGAKPLAASVTSGKRRDLSDAWAWDRKDRASDITQLVAVTLAMHGLTLNGHNNKTEVWGFWT